MMKNLFVVLAVTLFFAIHGWSAIQSPQKMKVYPAPTAIVGGMADIGFSLTDIQKVSDTKSKHERFIFSVGNLNGGPHKGAPGYYHAQLIKNPNRLTIDFSQMSVIYMSENKIKETFGNSNFVKSYKLVTDPIDKTTTLVLDLKKEVLFRAVQVKGEKTTSKVVVDLL